MTNEAATNNEGIKYFLEMVFIPSLTLRHGSSFKKVLLNSIFVFNATVKKQFFIKPVALSRITSIFSNSLFNAMKPIFILFLVCVFHSINLFGFDYGGFSLDETSLGNKFDRFDREIVEEVFKKQVNVVNAVILPAEMLAIIHAVPIKVTADLGVNDSYAGEYFPEGYQAPFHFTGSYICLNADLCFSSTACMPKLTLLHEFMHAIHDAYPPGNFNDPEIIGYFYDARRYDCYDFSDYGSSDPDKQYQEYLFTNDIEFFADTDKEPFSREAIKEQQPEYYAFLQRFFNPADSRYNPSYNWWNLDQTTY